MLNFVSTTRMHRACGPTGYLISKRPWSKRSRLAPGLFVVMLLLPVSIGYSQRLLHAHSIGASAGNQRAQGYLGIEFHDLLQQGSPVMRLRGPLSVEIVMVDHDGPAGKAGLRPHDLVQSLNGQPVSGAEALRQMIHDAGAGSTITIAVVRDGRPVNLSAQLESREDVDRRARARFVDPEPAPVAEEPENDDARQTGAAAPLSAGARGKRFIGEVLHGPSIGLQLETMPSQLAMFFGAPTNSGLLIASVEAGSAAATAGLAAGDILLRADSVALRSVSDWTKRLHASKGRALTLVVLRDHRELTLSLQPNGGRSRLDWPFHF